MRCAKDQKRKEVRPMKYEAPELTVLSPAIDAIQMTGNKTHVPQETPTIKDASSAYEDME